jgi:hypothetical protein
MRVLNLWRLYCFYGRIITLRLFGVTVFELNIDRHDKELDITVFNFQVVLNFSKGTFHEKLAKKES